ncbi:hypothetical protein V8C44DRAFT_332650 [Trichoderma aethiopicum]
MSWDPVSSCPKSAVTVTSTLLFAPVAHRPQSRRLHLPPCPPSRVICTPSYSY